MHFPDLAHNKHAIMMMKNKNTTVIKTDTGQTILCTRVVQFPSRLAVGIDCGVTVTFTVTVTVSVK